MLEERILHEGVLDRLRRDVLAIEGDDDVLKPIGDDEEAVVVDVPDVAGVQPTVLDRRSRLLRGLPVPLHDVRSAVEDLPVVSRRHPAAHQRPTGSAELAPTRGIEAHQWGCLSQAITLAHQQTARGEEFLDLLA